MHSFEISQMLDHVHYDGVRKKQIIFTMTKDPYGNYKLLKFDCLVFKEQEIVICN